MYVGLTVLTGLYGMAGSKGYDPAVIAKIAGLPGVRHVPSYADLNVELLEPGQAVMRTWVLPLGVVRMPA